MSDYQKSVRYLHIVAQEMRKAVELLQVLKTSHKKGCCL